MPTFPTAILHFAACLSKNNLLGAELAAFLFIHPLIFMWMPRSNLDQILDPPQGFWDIVYLPYNSNSHQAAINGDVAVDQITKSIHI